MGGEGAVIQFFEQAFDWEQMTYLFYPYFWARKENWIDKINYDDNDPLFAKFLQAGSARVILPLVTKEYSAAFFYYLENKDNPAVPTPIWNGGTPPGLNNDLWKSIVAELEKQQDPLAGGTPVKDSHWPVVVPTSLVYLQQGYQLPDFTTTPPSP